MRKLLFIAVAAALFSWGALNYLLSKFDFHQIASPVVSKSFVFESPKATHQAYNFGGVVFSLPWEELSEAFPASDNTVLLEFKGGLKVFLADHNNISEDARLKPSKTSIYTCLFERVIGSYSNYYEFHDRIYTTSPKDLRPSFFAFSNPFKFAVLISKEIYIPDGVKEIYRFANSYGKGHIITTTKTEWFYLLSKPNSPLSVTIKVENPDMPKLEGFHSMVRIENDVSLVSVKAVFSEDSSPQLSLRRTLLLNLESFFKDPSDKQRSVLLLESMRSLGFERSFSKFLEFSHKRFPGIDGELASPTSRSSGREPRTGSRR